jgi:hypothetical protein
LIVLGNVSSSELQSIEEELSCKVEIMDVRDQIPILENRVQCKLTIPYGLLAPKKRVSLLSMANLSDIFLLTVIILILFVCLIALVFHWHSYEVRVYFLISALINNRHHGKD